MTEQKQQGPSITFDAANGAFRKPDGTPIVYGAKPSAYSPEWVFDWDDVMKVANAAHSAALNEGGGVLQTVDQIRQTVQDAVEMELLGGDETTRPTPSEEAYASRAAANVATAVSQQLDSAAQKPDGN